MFEDGLILEGAGRWRQALLNTKLLDFPASEDAE